MRHDVQLGAVHGDDGQPTVRREAAHRNRLPRLGIDGNLDRHILVKMDLDSLEINNWLLGRDESDIDIE